MGDSSNMDFSGSYGDPGYGVLQSSGNYVDPSVFTGQDFSSAYGSPGYGVGDGSLAGVGGSGTGSATGSGFSLGGLLGGVGSTIGALLPALQAAGQIASMALRPQQQIPLHFPSFPQPSFAHFGGLSPQGMTAAPKLAGEAVTQYDPLNSYAELVRSMR